MLIGPFRRYQICLNYPIGQLVDFPLPPWPSTIDVFLSLFLIVHVWTVTLVAMQTISDDIKILCRCHRVQTVPWEFFVWHAGLQLIPNEIQKSFF